MNINSEIELFNETKKNIENLPHTFFKILQSYLKKTNAEFILLQNNNIEYDNYIDLCLIGYDKSETISDTNDFDSFCINNKSWTLKDFREKNQFLVDEGHPIWEKIINAVENDQEYEVLKSIYDFYNENFQNSVIVNFIDENTTNKQILITKDSITI